MSAPTATKDLRAYMPETARWVDRMREQYGKAHVNGAIRRALAGEPGQFYAIEQGHVLGKPFPANHPIAPDQDLAIQLGCTFAGFICTPEEAHGKD